MRRGDSSVGTGAPLRGLGLVLFLGFVFPGVYVSRNVPRDTETVAFLLHPPQKCGFFTTLYAWGQDLELEGMAAILGRWHSMMYSIALHGDSLTICHRLIQPNM